MLDPLSSASGKGALGHPLSSASGKGTQGHPLSSAHGKGALGYPLSSAHGKDALGHPLSSGSEGTLSAGPRHPVHVEDAIPLPSAETDSFASRERTPPQSTPLLGDLLPPACQQGGV